MTNTTQIQPTPELCHACGDDGENGRTVARGIVWCDDCWWAANRPPILDREPGPFAFGRADWQAAEDADHLAVDLRNERCDNTSWDRD